MKLLWFLWLSYVAFIIYTLVSYFRVRAISANIQITNTFYLKQILVPVVIMGISILFYLLKKPVLAKWIAGVPALIAAVVVGAGIIAWLGYAILHTLGGGK